MGRGELIGRLRAVWAFALLIAVCASTPVLAETLEAPEPPATESPQAVAEREDSEYAYVNLTPAQEEDLLQEHFAPQLEAIAADPARALDSVVINRIDSPTEALVTLDGQKMLLESAVPLRAPEEDGDLHKVDLQLEETATGFEPANPIVDLTLPGSADEPIEVGDHGLKITPLGTTGAPASPLGEEDLFLPAAREDTSFLLSPIAGGLELSALLASRNSPEQLAFAVDLPQGATLRADGAGGAEAVDAQEETIATISAPYAIDAQGSEVPVTLAVDGGTMTLSVPHRELDVAYPLFVDPEVTEKFADGGTFGYWKWSWGGVGPEDFIGRTSCIWTCWPGGGLYLRARSNFTYPAGSWGRFSFTPQGSTTFMRRVILGPINYDTHGCMGNEPHAYVGVWNDYSGWSVLADAYPSGWGSYVDSGENNNLGVGTRAAIAGMHASATSTLNCGRDYRLGGATLFLDDPENPVVGAPWGHPTGWIKDGASFTINGPVHDPGLGVKKGFLHLGGSVTLTREHACSGYYANPCWPNHTFGFAVGADSFDEGEKPLKFSAQDILGKPSNTYEWQVKVDRTPPEIDLAGQLAEATDEAGKDGEDTVDKALSLSVYKLQINTTDGKNPAAGVIAPAEKRSGVKKIEVFLDGKSAPEATWSESSCPSGNCPLSKTFTLKLNELSAGTDHTLRVLATDFAGNAPRERKIEFEFIPATGMKEEYVMQYFPLPDGSGNEDEEEHPRRPELAVNLVNGNLVYRQKDVEVETASADLEVELFYNSLLPESQNTEWGDGWTMAEEPALEIEQPASGAPTEATIVEESGAVESSVDLPTAVGATSFDKQIQATVTKEADGGFEVSDESGETSDSLEFSPSGRLEEVENGTSATVDYAYEGGDLAEISIEDPGTASVPPGSLDEDAVFPDLEISHKANFGTFGSEAGQLKAPADVAVDAAGNLYVLDRGNNRVQKFGVGGQLLSSFGSAGSANGQLSSPSAIALDSSGNLWIADTGNNRVQKFGPGGQYLAKFGSGSVEAGGFFGPSGIAVGSDGSIWVSDLNKVQRFTAAGQFIEQVGSNGSAPGQVSSPQSLDTGPGGNVFVAENGNDRISVFDEDGDFLRSFGSSGTGPGQFQTPAELDVDAGGNVWVGDSQTNRIQVFNAAGELAAQFGSAGTNANQFKPNEYLGIAVDGGLVWVSDAGNNRVQRWLASPFTEFLHSGNFGTTGSEAGQLKSPADVATDAEGNLYVLDRNNHRIQEFAPDGQFLAQFGGTGSGDGQLNEPVALALDANGDIWVADRGNSRVQKFGPGGQFLARFGSFGTADGSFFFLTGIAVGADGSIWASDGGRVQRFTPAGQFIEQVGSSGSGSGQISAPQSLDTAPGGNVLVTDNGNDRVSVFDKNGDFVRSFGSSGTGPGQFQNPAEVDVDPDGNVWIADSQVGRVQLFNAAGDYVAQFGSTGAEADQLKLSEHLGIAADEGRLWIADPGNNRIAEWAGGNYDAPSGPIPAEDDPQLEVNVSEGLVDTVEGEEAGTVDYDHSGDLLTSVEGPETDVSFEYDDKERLKKVTLANGTFAEITYEQNYNRVSSVTVAPQGANAKITHFSYTDDPRRTVVMAPDGKNTTYDFAADGSVFKWWSSVQPPAFDDISGTLYDPVNRETSQPIPTGAHTLKVQAHSDQGIASIQVVANNNQLVDEKTCTFDPAQPSACNTVSNEWVTETGNWPPGILYLEVIATDRGGRSVSQRFWVNIPYTPPPDPEAEEAPRFSDVLRFREEFGLDLDLKGDESAINDRVFDLIGAWDNPATPAGEVARATYASWGVPLRAVDVAELEYRERYIAQNGPLISSWGRSNHSSIYAGYYVDHRAGGVMRVGFASSQQTSLVGQVKSLAGILAIDRIAPFTATPNHPLEALENLQMGISAYRVAHPEVLTKITRNGIDIPSNRVSVGASEPSVVNSALRNEFGQAAPMQVYQNNSRLVERVGRFRTTGPIRGGDGLQTTYTHLCLNGKYECTWSCTAAFGAKDGVSRKQNGALINSYFTLTAGHCFEPGEAVFRAPGPNPEPNELERVGAVRRSALHYRGAGYESDLEAIKMDSPGLAPKWIYLSSASTMKFGPASFPDPGEAVCLSGKESNRTSCGAVTGPPEETIYEDLERGVTGVIWVVPANVYSIPGDSGSPIWNRYTGEAVGVVSGGPKNNFNITTIQPLTAWKGHELQAPGGMYAPEMAPLRVLCWNGPPC